MLNILLAAVNFVTVDPGHFHAALVQNRTYAEVAPEVRVFAPAGAELDAHLKLIESFNSRKEEPTAWREDVVRGDDYLKAFVAAAKNGKLGERPVAIFAGKNNRKGDYALAAVEAGVNVLSDKPMAITEEVFAKTEKAARLAQSRGLFFADIMTERNEITTILQRELAMRRDLYGEQEKGSAADPAVTKISVHHYCKLVNGAPLKRPEWYYDTNIQGEGITDVTTHLVDLVQWETFPGVKLAKSDVEIVSAKSWPTMITPEQFKTSTGGTIASTMAVEANGEFTWRLKGVNCKVSVAWNFMAPAGTGDTHYSLMRGTKAELVIEQGAKEGYKPVLYVRARGDEKATKKALDAALADISRTWPGLAAEATGEKGVWRIVYPKKYDVGHEAHFSQVVRMYLDWMKAGRQDANYIDNMIVKYHTIVEAWKKAHKPVKVGIIGLDTSHSLAFTEIMNIKRTQDVAGFKVVAAYQWGSRDIVSSTNRYPKYLPKMREMGVEIVPSIKDLLDRVDVVCLETNDGREHLKQAEEVFASGKRVFIDKPLAHNLADALKIYDAGVKYKAEYFSSSALRFTPVAMACRAGEYGPIAGAALMAPSPMEPQGTHNFYTWYGIHGFESLVTVMGAGVDKVTCLRNDKGDVVSAIWKDGRMGELRLSNNRYLYAGYIMPVKPKDKKNPLILFDGYSGYHALVREMVKFFETGKAPVSPEETIEIMAFMEAAEMSAKLGRPVTIAEAIEECREKPFWKFW